MVQVGVTRIKTGLFFLFLIVTSSLLVGMDKDAIDLFNQGERAIQQQDFYGAIDNLQEALLLNPAYLDAILALADAYFRIEEYEEAYQYIEMAARYGQNNIDLLNMKARILIGREDLDEGEILFFSVLEQEPNNLEANLGLAEISLLRGDRDRGVDGYRKSLILAPESRRALLSLALLYDLEERYDEAEEYLDLAHTYHSRDPYVYISLAEHYLRSGDVNKAAYYAQNGTLIAPQMLGPYKLLGQAFMEKEEWQLAIDPLIQALSREPQSVTLLYMLSQCYINLSMDLAALKMLDKALRIDPYDEVIRITMEQFLINNPSLAVGQREKLGSYHYEMGRDFERGYYFDKAYNEYRRGKWINPYDWTGWIGYGKILNIQGFKGKYLDTMQAIKESGYEDSSFLETLKILEHKSEESLASEWGIDQFDIQGNPYSIALFPQYSDNLIHTGSEQAMGDYLKFILLRYSQLDPHLGGNIRAFSDAYASARRADSDYFILLDFSETERIFLCTATLYLTSTGAKITDTTVMRTGKGRVSLAMEKLAENLESLFLRRTVVLDLDEDILIVGQGRFQGVEEETEAILVKRGGSTLLSAEPWVNYQQENLLGIVTITQVDEEVSLGNVESYSLFNLINPGDELYFLPVNKDEKGLPQNREEEDTLENKERFINSELKNQLLRLN